MGTPIPSSDKESASSGASDVKEYNLSPEELSRYRAMPAKARDGNGRIRKQPVAAHYELDQQRQAKTRNESEDSNMKNQPSRNEYLRLRAAGKSHAEIESILQLSKNVLSSHWLPKWDLKGITQEKAAEMIADREAALPVDSVATSPTASLALDDQSALIESLRSELEGARTAHANSIEMLGTTSAKLQAEIDELRNDRDEWRRTANLIKEQSGERIRQLEADMDLIREPVIIEVAAPQPAGYISLRFPLIDTGDQDIAGRLKSIETIGDIKGKPLDITGIDFPRLAREGLEIMQVIVGIIRAITIDIAEPADVERTLQQFFGRHNETHIADLRSLAADRGWEVVS